MSVLGVKNRPCVVGQNLDSGLVRAAESPLCALQPYERHLHLLVKPFSLRVMHATYLCHVAVTHTLLTFLPRSVMAVYKVLSLLIFQSDVNIEQRSPTIFVQAQFLNGKAKQC